MCCPEQTENNLHNCVIAGISQGLRLTLNVESQEFMAGPLPGSGVMILLHDPDVKPHVRNLAYALSPGSHVLMSVVHTRVRMEWQIPFSHSPSSERSRLECLQMWMHLKSDKVEAAFPGRGWNIETAFVG